MGIEIKTSGKSKNAEKSDRLTVESPIIKLAVEGKKSPVKVVLVDKMIDLSQQIENLDGELKNYRQQLLDHTTIKRKESLDQKIFVKTVDVSGTNAKIQVQYQDRYSSLAPDMEKPLKEIFEENFNTMFTVNESQTLRENKMVELKEILGDRFDAFFDTHKTINPVKEFQYNYFLMEKKFNSEQTETIQKVFAACQSTPAVKFPK